ncbi:MAG: TetR/AcrR family transcriptional regulator [Myxococcaceae bacterium]|jgi:AcrR family transcriptional regulator|nr:TetR/AcrR family transcriptional regulator [Myxococcaceae bacterium]MCA3013281.1 TetR/AcrR family transcriptional regulator [Myxococcaceae bacterium]
MARPRKTEARDTRREILDRSLELFAERGFSGSSMRDLARAVGVRESALYHHFPNKKAILEAILAENGPGQVNAVLSNELEAMVEALGPRQFLETFGELVVQLWATPRERQVVRLLMAEWPRLAAAGVFDLQAQLARIRARLTRLFEHLGSRGVIRPLDAEATALRFMGPMLLIRLVHLADLSRPPDLTAMRRDLALHLDGFWESVRPAAAPTRRRRP